MTSIIKSLRYDDNFENYAGYFDHQWVTDFERVSNSTILSKPATDLMLEWKANSCVRRWPWMMMHAIKGSIENSQNSNIPERFHIKLDLQSIWKSYLDQPEFVMGLWMSEISAYCAIYFAYEVFLIDCLKLITRQSELRAPKLHSEIQQLLGKSVASHCWTDKPIEIARLIRHAIVHNGRQMTSDLEKFRKEILLQENEVVIFASDTTALFNLLKDRVRTFAETLINHQKTTAAP